MTTNVPQDVIDDLDAAAEFADDNVERYSDLDDDSKEKVGKFAIKFLQLRNQRAGGEAVFGAAPELKEGEIYAGILLGQNGSADQHIILLPGDNDEANHADSTAWAESIGGELPNRREQSLLFANLKEEFQHDWYWSCETHAANADCAWSQLFGYGSQVSGRKGNELRARAVRRVTVVNSVLGEGGK